jgi:hypothetical protein
MVKIKHHINNTTVTKLRTITFLIVTLFWILPYIPKSLALKWIEKLPLWLCSPSFHYAHKHRLNLQLTRNVNATMSRKQTVPERFEIWTAPLENCMWLKAEWQSIGWVHVKRKAFWQIKITYFLHIKLECNLYMVATCTCTNRVFNTLYPTLFSYETENEMLLLSPHNFLALALMHHLNHY